MSCPHRMEIKLLAMGLLVPERAVEVAFHLDSGCLICRDTWTRWQEGMEDREDPSPRTEDPVVRDILTARDTRWNEEGSGSPAEEDGDQE